MSAGRRPVRAHRRGRDDARVHRCLVVPLIGHAAGACSLGRSEREHRWVAEIGGPLGRGEHERNGAVDLVGAVEHAEGFDDPAAGHVVVERQRVASDRVRVVHSMHAIVDGDRAEVCACGAVHVLVSLGPHREPLWRHHVAVRCGELLGTADGHLACDLAVADVGVEHAVHHHDLGLPSDDRRGGVGHDQGDLVAAGQRVDRPADLVEADGVGDAQRAGRVARRVAGHPVDVGGCQPGVV